MRSQILAPFKHYFCISIIFGNPLNEILYSFSSYESSVAFPVPTNPCLYSMGCCDLLTFLILPQHCFHFLNLYQCFHIFIFFLNWNWRFPSSLPVSFMFVDIRLYTVHCHTLVPCTFWYSVLSGSTPNLLVHYYYFFWYNISSYCFFQYSIKPGWFFFLADFGI